MAIEHARANAISKPWGFLDTHPFRNAAIGDGTIGEIWYERDGADDFSSSLLLKLLFTSQPLSIQVHPDDAYAKSIGQRNGKTEAWYILRAAPDAKIALGLKAPLTSQQLRKAIDDGSIANLVAWKPVFVGDSFFVPAGTIHAIGAGLVIAEIQQRSDATFRIFDYGRNRELHVDHAVDVSDAGPAGLQADQTLVSSERTQVIANQLFVMERVDLAPYSAWHLETDRETWLLGVNGGALVGLFTVAPGKAIFVQSDGLDIRVGPTGFIALVSYTGGPPLPRLLTRIEEDSDRHEVLQNVAIDIVASGAGPKIPTAHRSGIVQ
jgi:mannose-6-phosphate isomerase